MSLLLSQLGAVETVSLAAQSAGPIFSKTVLYQAYTVSPIPPASIGWFQPLTEPQRFKPRLQSGLHQFTAFNPLPAVSFSWIYPYTDPVRIKPRLQTGLQQTLAFNTLPVVSFGWYRSLEEPKRFRPSLTPAQHQFYTTDPFPIPPLQIGWYQAFSEPKRFRPELRPAQQQFQAFDPFPLQNPVLLNWFQPLSEPKRFKPDLKTSAHIFLAFDPNPIPTPPERAQGGYLPYHEHATLGWGAIRAYPQVIVDIAFETAIRGLPEPMPQAVIAAMLAPDKERLTRIAEAAAAFDLELVMKYLEAMGIDFDG